MFPFPAPEDEDAILVLNSKLDRFDKDENQWKERGAGTMKFLKHKVTGKVRFLMRQSKTLKICANHLILPTMNVQQYAGNEKSCVWHARDFADGEFKDELFCIRFTSIENCKSFMEKFQQVVAESQKPEESNRLKTIHPPPVMLRHCNNSLLMPPSKRVVFPDKVIEEILSFVPVKSLLRLRCVCKSWKILMADPLFIKRHIERHHLHPHHRLPRTDPEIFISGGKKLVCD